MTCNELLNVLAVFKCKVCSDRNPKEYGRIYKDKFGFRIIFTSIHGFLCLLEYTQLNHEYTSLYTNES